jgi:murein L,D-transpeptidase YcbB/YkuD
LQAAKAARALQGQWRRAQFDDPEVFYAAMKRLFLMYPEDIVSAVVAPGTGMASKQTFPPSQSEVVAELNRLMEAEAAKERRHRDRDEFLRLTAPVPVSATSEERERAVAYYLQQVRPLLVTGDTLKPVLETAEDALERVLTRAESEPLPALSDTAKVRDHG